MEVNPREIALNILLEVNQNSSYSNIELNKIIDKNIDIRDEKLIRELVYGVLENKLYIDEIIKSLSRIKFNKIHKKILDILRLGIYQLVFMDRIPPSAAVNESVNLAKKYGHKGSMGFVNGILREFNRNKSKYTIINTDNEIDRISIKYSHPKFLVEKWIDDYGVNFTEELCAANNQKPKLNIRVNTLQTNKDDLVKSLVSKGFLVSAGIYAEDSLIIENPKMVTDLDEYLRGDFTIQDESSMLVAQVMAPKEGQMVLDLCSAPGGKSTHIAQYMDNKGLIVSRDIFEHKIDLVESAAKRLGIKIIQTQLHDATLLDNSLIDKFDHCLVDAPCSGLGIIRRKPEIKWNKKSSEFQSLVELQQMILYNAKRYIKIGGNLVYSTCTISPEENINIVEEFLKENKNFEFVNIQDKFKDISRLNSLEKGYIQLFPHIHGTDGFFIAKLIRKY